MSRMLDILQSFLSHHNYKYFRLDGATPIDQRQVSLVIKVYLVKFSFIWLNFFIHLKSYIL